MDSMKLEKIKRDNGRDYKRDNGRDYKRDQRTGTPFDQHRCFFIKDFNKGDAIRVKINGVTTRGVVSDIDLDTMEVVFSTFASQNIRAFLNDIVSLEEYQKDWLNQ